MCISHAILTEFRSLAGISKYRFTTRRGSLVFGFHSVVDAIDGYMAVAKQLDEYNTAHNVSAWAPNRANVEFLKERYSSRGFWYKTVSDLPPITIKEEADFDASDEVGE